MSGVSVRALPTRTGRRSRPPTSSWASAVVALVAVVALAAAGRFVGTGLVDGCTSGAPACTEVGDWLARGLAVQVVLGVVALALVALVAVRRARGVRRGAVAVILLAVLAFFGSTLLAAGAA